MRRCWLALLLFAQHIDAQDLRWNLAPDGGISWTVGRHDVHTDHLEMSGKGAALILTYGTDSVGGLVWKQHLVFPSLRVLPNDTRGSLAWQLVEHILDSVTMDGQPLNAVPISFYIKGCLRVYSIAHGGIHICTTVFPSVDKMACVEEYTLTNTSRNPIRIHIPRLDADSTTAPGVYGRYVLNRRTYDAGDYILDPAGSLAFSLVLSARKEADPAYDYSADYEWERRKAFVEGLGHALVLETPNDTLDRMFAFAKVRAAESIYDTRSGLMHGPGGGEYYAAIWANDQAEYADPFFPFIGDAAGNESARNSFRLFAAYINPDFKPIPSSIVAEGTSFWNGAGDRGDQAMIAYGASRFALALGDTIEALRLWPLIDWCLEYLRRQETSAGVIASRSDELEGRFPSGKVNLSTNVLAYGGFLSASRLAAGLGKPDVARRLGASADTLRARIGSYFGARVQGFDTYRYYEGNTLLRSWICLPLVMGMTDRKDQTVRALLSPYLWTSNGILTEAGSSTFWDRATLYAFRGLFYAGQTDTSLRYFDAYSRTRLLGAHVPYAVEAWPEGDQRHLSAESALYCRVVTEGLFGIDPLGFRTFSLMPRLPAGWDRMSLSHMRAFGHDVDVRVRAVAPPLEEVVISEEGKVVKKIIWNRQNPIIVHL